MIEHLTEENFHTFIESCDKPVLVDFWATWCGPCRMLAPVIEEIAEENEDVQVCKLDVDEAPAIAQEYGVMSIPTIIVFKNGEPAASSVGVRPKADLLELLA